MGLIVVLFAIVFLLMILFMINSPETLTQFSNTSTITKEIIPFTILSFIAMGLGGLFIVLLSLMVVKMIIPDFKVFSSIMMKKELKFILDLPSKIGEEVLKNGK